MALTRGTLSTVGQGAPNTPANAWFVTPLPQSTVFLYGEATTSRTATGNSTNQTWVNNVDQAFVGINVTAVTGTSPTLTVSIQQQDSNGIFQTIASSSSITAVGTYSFSVGQGLTNAAMLASTYRIVWTIGGTTPNFTFQVGVSGR